MITATHGIIASSKKTGFAFFAEITPVDYVSSNTVTVSSANDYEVDWGDGSFTTYSGSNPATSVASNADTGIITVRSTLAANSITLGTNTFTALDIQNSSTLTSAFNMGFFLSNLTSFNIDDASNIADFRQMFRGCTGLTSLPFMDTSSGTQFNDMLNGCTNLVCLSAIDTATSATSATGMFTGCSSMTAPTSGEQTSIATIPSGLDYVNAGACP